MTEQVQDRVQNKINFVYNEITSSIKNSDSLAMKNAIQINEELRQYYEIVPVPLVHWGLRNEEGYPICCQFIWNNKNYLSLSIMDFTYDWAFYPLFGVVNKSLYKNSYSNFYRDTEFFKILEKNFLLGIS